MPEGPKIIADANERMSQYLDDQSSIVGYSHVAQDSPTMKTVASFISVDLMTIQYLVVGDWEAPLFLLPIVE